MPSHTVFFIIIECSAVIYYFILCITLISICAVIIRADAITRLPPDGFIGVKLVPQGIFNEEMILWMGHMAYVLLNMVHVDA